MISNIFSRILPTIRPIYLNQQQLVRLLGTQANPTNREKGIVKRFSKEKGFGFISKTDDGTDYFVHFKNINATGFRTLEQGQEVEFTAAQGEKGLEAKDVNIINDVSTSRKSFFDGSSRDGSFSSRRNFANSSRNRSSLFEFGGTDSSKPNSNSEQPSFLDKSFKFNENLTDSGKGKQFSDEKSTNEQTSELGSVRRWTPERGFGFIRRANTGQDIFCHARSLNDGLQALKPGQTVQYTVHQTEKGAEARDVTIVEGDDVKLPIKDNSTSANVGERQKGTVKKWIGQRGFGFIERENGGDDIFVHVQSLKDGVQSLEEGQIVEFNVAQSEKGDAAQNVTVLNERRDSDNNEIKEKKQVSNSGA